MAYLVLVRHGLSEYNKKGLWTGWHNPPLAPEGKEEARRAAEQLTDIHLDIGYTSPLQRNKQTLEEIRQKLNEDLHIIENPALNERNYGMYTAKNKWQIKEQLGEQEFMKLRRSWDYPIPQGESLKQVYERVIPYYVSTILPQLKSGKNVILASSGNALRSLMKYLERISDEDISKLEIGTGEVWIYQVDSEGEVVSKEIRNPNPATGKQ